MAIVKAKTVAIKMDPRRDFLVEPEPFDYFLDVVTPSKIVFNVTSRASLDDYILEYRGSFSDPNNVRINTVRLRELDGSTAASVTKINWTGNIDDLNNFSMNQVFAGNDRIIGSNMDDFALGLGGNDRLDGRDGNDILKGGSGNDLMTGGSGDDVLSGGSGNDRLDGNAGDDRLSAGGGNDRISGGDDNDTLNGGGGNDNLAGNAGDDVLNGGGGNDKLSGGAGDDNLKGSGGNDNLKGGAGNDVLNGNGGKDVLAGGTGDDTYIAGKGDLIKESAGNGTDTVQSSFNYTLDNNVENLLLLGGGNLKGVGNALDNMLTGNSGNNNLIGRDGDDTLLGNGGNDTLAGNAGDDVLDGGLGTDALNGGDGDDILAWDANDNAVNGGSGTDTLRVDAGDVDLPAFTGLISGLEVIDLGSDAGANSVTLSAQDVLDLSDNDVLTILGDGGDSVDAGTGWTQQADDISGNHVFTQMVMGTVVTLVVDPDLTTNPDILM